MGRWIKKHKGLFIFLCIFLTLALLIGGVIACTVNMSKAMLETMLTNETAVVERRDLVEAISASGTIVSSDSVMVTARVNGVDVAQVNVEVGDWVEAGTLICVLDSSKLEETLAIAEANLAATEQQLNMTVAAAQRQYNDAVNAQNQANQSAQTSVAEAERALALAKESYNSALATYNNTCNEFNPIITKINEIINYDQNARNTLRDIENEISSLSTQIADLNEKNKDLKEGDEGYTEYADKVATLSGQIMLVSAGIDSVLKEKVDAVRVACGPINYTDNNELNIAKGKIESTISSAQIGKDSAYNSLCSMQIAYDNAVANASNPSSSTVAAARDNLANAQTNAETGTMSAEQQIESYQEQINNCAVYAPISGIVTSVNVNEGDLYAGTPIVTIENTSAYDVETYISEYDISKIKVGQEVVIKTNGTGDAELEGIVKSVAPRAAVGLAAVAYKVVVQVNTQCEDLRLDMTARLSIILTKAENVVTVPYESVQFDDDGNTYVEVAKGKDPATGIDLKEKVYVTTGVESAYYIEITSGALAEGVEVVVPRSEYGGFDIYALLEEEGALGGY